ncbi:MAG: leucine-rich repeat domain-containing protein [Candidatus Methanoplasma sp.]|nr:leucine-rich repeat domain-containing protein [Candidatus Methanoplasma sp.]
MVRTYWVNYISECADALRAVICGNLTIRRKIHEHEIFKRSPFFLQGQTQGGGGNYNFPSRLNITVLFAATLFLAAAFFVTYSEPDESDAYGDPTFSFTLDSVNYKISGSNVNVVGWENGISADLEIPVTVIQNEIQYTVTSINLQAFSGCNILKTVTIQGNVGTIGNSAFASCTNLISVVILNSVTTIGNQAFFNCGNLETVTIGGNVGNIGNNAFDRCTNLGNEAVKAILKGVTTIGNSAFSTCTSLVSVTIPDSVTSIGNNAFANCDALETVTIGGRVEKIDSSVFSHCTNLESIVIPSSVTTISTGAFASSSLKSVTIPDSVTFSSGYGQGAFYGCANLTSVTVTGVLDGEGKTVAGGIIDTYFKKGKDWKLPGMSDPTPIKSLTLKDISSLDYDPDNENGGIAGDEGRELYYSNTKFTWNTEDSKWDVSTYTVTLGKGTEGICGFEYSTVGSIGPAVTVNESFTVNHGDTVIITALLSEGYEFVSWSGYPESSEQNPEENPLTVPYVSENISLTAYASLIPVPTSASDTLYLIVFDYGDYGSGCTVYVNGSPVPLSSSQVTVTEGENLIFAVSTPEGYTVYPSVVSGTADITLQADGRYRLSDIRSDIRISITVNTVSGDGSIGNGSGDSPYGNGIGRGGTDSTGNGGGSGNESNSTRGSGNDGIPAWVPVLLVLAFLTCIAAFLIVKRSKNRQ